MVVKPQTCACGMARRRNWPMYMPATGMARYAAAEALAFWSSRNAKRGGWGGGTRALMRRENQRRTDARPPPGDGCAGCSSTVDGPSACCGQSTTLQHGRQLTLPGDTRPGCCETKARRAAAHVVLSAVRCLATLSEEKAHLAVALFVSAAVRMVQAQVFRLVDSVGHFRDHGRAVAVLERPHAAGVKDAHPVAVS